LASGDAVLEIEGFDAAGAPDSDTFESIMCVGSCSSSSEVPAARALAAQHRLLRHHRAAGFYHVDLSHVGAHRMNVSPQ
jgi:hypothetical protein